VIHAKFPLRESSDGVGRVINRSNVEEPVGRKIRMNVPRDVVGRFAYKHQLAFQEASLIFERLESFLKNSAVHNGSPDQELDEAWHEFILHTRLYETYCLKNFDHFVHHVPSSPVQMKGQAPSGVVTQTTVGSCDATGGCTSDCATS